MDEILHIATLTLKRFVESNFEVGFNKSLQRQCSDVQYFIHPEGGEQTSKILLKFTVDANFEKGVRGIYTPLMFDFI